MAKILIAIEYFLILRPQQWYKNLLVFLPIFFAGQALNTQAITLAIFGFIALSLVSSANYIINDIADKQQDKYNPEKSNKPITAEKVSTKKAGIISGILLIAGLVLSYRLSQKFAIAAIILFGITQLYTFVLKKEVLADILLIAINFVIRAVSGTFLTGLTISPWLVLCPFFLAIFLAVGKRHAELTLLGTEAEKTRTTLKQYTKELTTPLLIISTTALIISYALYSFLSNHNLLFSLPFALYVIFRYFAFITQGSQIARSPELIIKDWRMLVGITFWIITVFVGI